METDRIYNEDCLEGMKRLPDNSIDAIITDPPYGTTDASWNRKIVDPVRMWEQFKRVAKPNAAMVIFGQMPFSVDIVNANRKMFRYEWIWEKTQGVGFLNAKKMPLRAHEQALVFYRQLPTYNPQFWQGKPYRTKNGARPADGCYGHCSPRESVNESGLRYPLDVLKFNHDPIRYNSRQSQIHSTPKPTALFEYLIRTYTNEDELVLDAFMGSGTTAVAAINTGRHFIGFELSEEFHALCERRIAEAIATKKPSEDGEKSFARDAREQRAFDLLDDDRL